MRVPEPFAAKVLEARDEARGAKTLQLSVPHGFDFVPGQWVMLHFPDGDPKERRAYSLASSPLQKGSIELTIGLAGNFTTRLFALKEGDTMMVRGPFGKWVFDETARRSVLVSEGTGVTPFRSMVRYAVERGIGERLTLLCSAADEASTLYRDEHEEWRRGGVDVRFRVGEHVTPEEALAAGGPDAVYYLCGANRMVEALKKGLEGRQVRHEKWGDYDLSF